MPRKNRCARATAPRPEWANRWDEIKPAPFRVSREIVPGLYQLRTRGSRAYLVADSTLTLIDTGSPGSGLRILAALREIGRSPAEISQILITHHHIDHVGGLPEVQAFVPARTGVHLAEAPHVLSEEPLPNPFQHPLLARVMEGWLLRNDPGAARVDVLLADGDELPGLGGIRVVHAPGHTPGSISIHLPEAGVLIVGDAMQYKFGRLMLPSRLFSQDMAAAGVSVRKLARLDFETLCFSHFRPIVAGADRRVRAFAGSLAG